MMTLDSRIGMLNNGEYYAFVNGYDQPEIRGTLHKVMKALGLCSDKKENHKNTTTIKKYVVVGTYKFPDCYNHGFEFEVYAKNKSEANKIARNMAQYEGHTRMDGPLYMKATEIE